MSRRDTSVEAPAAARLGESIADLRRGLRTIGQSLAQVAAQLHGLERQASQLALLRHADATAAADLDAIERALDFESASRHVRDAIGRSPVSESPAPHAIVADLWPDALYRAVLDAVPSLLFFETRADGRHVLPLPPSIAPLPAIVTWEFVVELLRRAVMPALLDGVLWGGRIDPSSGHASRARLVARRPGAGGALRESTPLPTLTAVIYLGEADGVDGRLVPRQGGDGMPILFRPNTALVFPGGAARYEYAEVGEPVAERYTCEVRMGVGQPRSRS